MTTLKKIVLTTIVISSMTTLALPSYADEAPTAKPKKHHHEVAYNNLTNNFAATTINNNTVSTEPNPWTAMVAAGGGIGPKYPGSNNIVGMSAFALSASYKNRFFISSGQGLGVNFINTAPFTVGTSVNYSYGNNFRSKEFSGLNDPKNAFTGSVFANYTLDLFNFSVMANKTIGQLAVAGYYQASITRAVPLTQHLVLNLMVSSQYDDARYMQSLYGVTSEESSTSGLPTYNTQSGWDNISYSITPMYNLSKHWILTGSLAGVSYLNQVATSPLMAHKQNYAVLLGAIYNIF